MRYTGGGPIASLPQAACPRNKPGAAKSRWRSDLAGNAAVNTRPQPASCYRKVDVLRSCTAFLRAGNGEQSAFSAHATECRAGGAYLRAPGWAAIGAGAGSGAAADVFGGSTGSAGGRAF